MYQSFAILAVCFAAAVRCEAVVEVPQPVITPAPSAADLATTLARRQGNGLDPIRLANELLEVFPQSLAEIAITDIAQVSRILWSEFLDTNTPSWFRALPSDIQGYLSNQYGPTSLRVQTTATPSASSGATNSASTGSVPTSNSALRTSRVASDSTPASSIVLDSTAAPSIEENTSSRGLSTAQKIGIGLGVPLGVLTVAALIFLCCFLARRRRRRNTTKDVDERAPTPAFISSSHQAPSMQQKWAPLPVPVGNGPRGRDSAYGSGDPFQDGPYGHTDAMMSGGYPNGNNFGTDRYDPMTAAGVGIVSAPRRSRGNSASRSRNSLQSVRESPMEFTHDHAATAVPAPPARRSRTSLNGNGNGIDTSTLGNGVNGAAAMNGRRSMDANGMNGVSAMSPLNPSYNNASNLDSTHPAFRSSSEIPAMWMRPRYAQNHYNTPFGGGIAAAAPRTKGYTSIAAPEESYQNGGGYAPESSSHGARTNGLKQRTVEVNNDYPINGDDTRAYSHAYDNANDWPLSDNGPVGGSRWSAGSKSEKQPLWSGNVYEGT